MAQIFKPMRAFKVSSEKKAIDRGVLHIKRETIRGLEPIEFFDIHKPKEVI